MQQFTEKKGYYRKRELGLLATSLGFPGSLLVNRFRIHHTATEDQAAEEADGGEKTVSEKMIVRLLNSGDLFKRLEKVFNIYPAWYNMKLIRKAMQHIRHHSLSFTDISDCRRAFDIYAYGDGSGMPAELLHVRQALKVLERIMSPSRLQMEIQRFNDVSDVPSRLQLYEFMDIVAICGKTEVEERRLSEISISDEVSHELSVPDFGHILMTTDQKVSAYLESNYQQSFHRGKESPIPQLVDTLDCIVHTDSRKSLVSLAAEQSRALTPCLECSQSQLHRSRNGYCDENFEWSHTTSRQPSPIKPKEQSTVDLLSKQTAKHSQGQPTKPSTNIQNSQKPKTAKSSQLNQSKTAKNAKPNQPKNTQPNHPEKNSQLVCLKTKETAKNNHKQPTEPATNIQNTQKPKTPQTSQPNQPTPAKNSQPNQLKTAKNTQSNPPDKTNQLMCQKPIRLRLHHLPSKKPAAPNSESQQNKDSERLRKTINDICADSVLKARETLQSSMFTISPPCQSTHQVSETMNTEITMEAPKTTSESVSMNRNHEFHVDPVVTEEERRDQQELIDDLMWSTPMSKLEFHPF